jgi:transposase-like protein
VVANVTADNVERVMREYVAESAVIDTDELALYPRATRTFVGHRAVRHRADEYVGKEGQSTNNAESFFSRIKRSIYGVHHKVSREHLHRYATHMEFLHNTRRMMDGERIGECIRMAVGRLTQRAVS